MKYNISFQERAKLGLEQLSKQLPVTLQEAKQQVQWLKNTSNQSKKKQRDWLAISNYYNPTLGIILEDLHDENVLTQDGILYFIDTVFYVNISQRYL